VLSVGNARKNDRLDATFTALAALSNERLARVTSEDSASARVEVLRLISSLDIALFSTQASIRIAKSIFANRRLDSSSQPSLGRPEVSATHRNIWETLLRGQGRCCRQH
jgi:hypothetical protein